jgi:hypothetical protein
MTTVQAAHAARLRECSHLNCPMDRAALLAGAAALDEVATLRAERDEARADCKSFWKLRAGLAERQLETLRARVAQLEAALRTIHLTCAEITEFVRSALSEVPHGR